MRVNEHDVRVWLLDRRLAPVPPAGNKLVLTIRPKGRPAQTVTLAPERDHFHAAVDLAGLPDLTVSAQLTTGSRTFHASLRWTIMDATDRIEDSVDGVGLRVDPDQQSSVGR
jgi:hypothetical protein